MFISQATREIIAIDCRVIVTPGAQREAGDRDDIVGRKQRGGELMFPGRAGVPGSDRAAMLPGAPSCLAGGADSKQF